MMVEVDTRKITDLENRVQELGRMVTAIVAKSPKGVRIKPAEFERAGSVEISTDDAGVVLLKFRKDADA